MKILRPLVLAALFLAPSILSGPFTPLAFAQSLEPVEEEYPVIVPDDPGADEDPAAEAAELPTTLGFELEAGNIDPVYFDDPSTEAVPGMITPIGLVTGTSYFSYQNQLTPLVGVSADNACHLHLGNGDICRYNLEPGSTTVRNYQRVLSDAHAKGLNKIRLWVSINGGDFIDPKAGCTARKPHPEDQPFVYTAPAQGSNLPYGIGTWRLDQRNVAYFDHLREVVQYAKNFTNPPMIVEVTFFAPWEAVWELGPWHPAHGRDATGSVGFTDRSYFVKRDTNAATQATNQKMRQYQEKVIDWTVDALIGFDNVYWEIANEPEAFKTSVPTCGPDPNPTVVGPKPMTALASDVALWQGDMIGHLKTYETGKMAAAGLTRRHMVAVQPFSVAGANLAKSNPDIMVVNGHYTTVATANGGLGAITLAQTAASMMKSKGFNEGKISAIGGNQGIYGPDVPPPAEQTDVARARSVRAEAWEFMLDGGGAFDHYGYYYSSPVGAAVRTQLGALRRFLDTWMLFGTKTSANPPGWIGLKTHADALVDNVNWGALETKPGELRRFVAYIHHSRSRSNLAFQGYEPLLGSYTDSLRLCLGNTAGNFVVKFKNMETKAETRIVPDLAWGGVKNCYPRAGQGTLITVGPYAYDVLITVEEVP